MPSIDDRPFVDHDLFKKLDLKSVKGPRGPINCGPAQLKIIKPLKIFQFNEGGKVFFSKIDAFTCPETSWFKNVETLVLSQRHVNTYNASSGIATLII